MCLRTVTTTTRLWEIFISELVSILSRLTISIYFIVGRIDKGVMLVKTQPAQRAVTLGQYIIENRATVRSAAKKFGISKSTVHTVVSKENGI